MNQSSPLASKEVLRLSSCSIIVQLEQVCGQYNTSTHYHRTTRDQAHPIECLNFGPVYRKQFLVLSLKGSSLKGVSKGGLIKVRELRTRS